MDHIPFHGNSSSWMFPAHSGVLHLVPICQTPSEFELFEQQAYHCFFHIIFYWSVVALLKFLLLHSLSSRAHSAPNFLAPSQQPPSWNTQRKGNQLPHGYHTLSSQFLSSCQPKILGADLHKYVWRIYWSTTTVAGPSEIILWIVQLQV